VTNEDHSESYQNTVISKTAKISADHSINKRQDDGPQNDNQLLLVLMTCVNRICQTCGTYNNSNHCKYIY